MDVSFSSRNSSILFLLSYSDSLTFYKAYFTHNVDEQIRNAHIIANYLNARVYLTDPTQLSRRSERRYYLNTEYRRTVLEDRISRRVVYFHIPYNFVYSGIPDTIYETRAQELSIFSARDSLGTYTQ